MAGDVSVAIDADQVLSVVGSSDDDHLELIVDSNRQSIDIRADGKSIDTVRIADVRTLQVSSGDGNDQVRIVDASQALESANIRIRLDGGEGDDTFAITAASEKTDEFSALRNLTDLADELRTIVSSMGEATTRSLTKTARETIVQARDRLVEATSKLELQVSEGLLPNAEQLVQQEGAEMVASFHELLLQVDQHVAKTEAFIDQASTLLADVSEPDTDAQPDASYEGENEQATADRIATEAEALATEAELLVAPSEATYGTLGAKIETRGNEIAAFAESILTSATELSETSESESEAIEAEARSGEAVIMSQAESLLVMVESMIARMTPVTSRLLEAEAMQQAAVKPARAASSNQTRSGAKCVVQALHTFNGGGGNDIFFPFSAPSQSWLINGGAGNDLLLGGFADDEINGGAGTDLIFGLGGNDLIHGDAGTDLLFGEFLIDISAWTGNDCVYGDDGIDLVVGDNGVDLLNNATIGGDDDLHGGDAQDLVIGDDISDIFVPQPGGVDTMYGDGELDIMFGTGGNDTLYGGAHIDAQFGNAGMDKIYASDGTFTGDGWTIPSTPITLGALQFGNDDEDKLYGANGLDVQFGNKDKDEIHGNAYVDVQFGGDAADLMYGESGGVIFYLSSVPVRFGNLMFGGNDVDTMWGGGDLDLMLGNAGNDKMYGYDGNFEPLGIDADVMLGGDGDDTMEGDDESLLLFTSSDWMFGQDGDDTMDGGKQSDYMFGGRGNDVMTGDSNGILLVNSRDLMFGGPGQDTMDGGNSFDLMFGGADADTMKGDDESIGLITSYDLMFGNGGNDVMNGGSQSDIMFGGDGNDDMQGDSNSLLQLLSNDLMFGQDGADTMAGGNGMDAMFGGKQDDRMTGDNSVIGLLTSRDMMFGNEGDDQMDGGANQDLMFGNDGCDNMMGDNGSWWMPLSIDVMFGNAGCDAMKGGRGSDLMFGNDGIDRMDGEYGVDLMFGNAGTDVMSGGDLPDIMFGNADGDVIHGDNGFDLVFGNDGDDCLYGDNSLDLVFGGDGNDCIHGGDQRDLLFGNSGADKMFGENGNDLMFGNSGNDKLDGGAGRDTLFGNSDDDELWGGPARDNLFGNSGNDTLWGGSHPLDLLVGGSGSDTTTQGGPDSSGIVCSCVILPCKFDYGDAPNSYNTLLPSGARHGLVGPRLGPNVDYEANGMPTALADGDDTSGIDDEDGVAIGTLLAGATTPITVTLSNASIARLDAWVDFNGNGSFDNSEQVATNLFVNAGANTVNVLTPIGAVAGTTYARFRVSSAGGLGPAGMSMDGEVEDYRVTIERRQRDYGDAPNSYQTTIGVGGASHDLGGPKLGTLIDAEPDGQPSAGANRDDATTTDDEDGVIVSSLVPGGTSTTAVTLSGATSAKLDAWVDFNGNGAFDHPAEQIFNGVSIVAGLNNLSFAVPITSVLNTYARFRVSQRGVSSPVGFGGVGEVEDYQVFGDPATEQFDFGDAPKSYQTLLASTGAYHLIGGPQLGALIDPDADGQPSATADGDDLNSLDDEDGVSVNPLIPGGFTTATVILANAASAKLNAWVDFNGNGTFDHPAEQIFNAVPIAAGANSLSFAVPLTTSWNTYARFRVSPQGVSSPAGFGGVGEVEDYQVFAEQPQEHYDFGDAPDSYQTLLAANGPYHLLGGPQLGMQIDSELDGVPTPLANGDDSANVDDEDGVTLSPMSPGGVGTATVVVSGAPSGVLEAWIDFDGDGSFSQPQDHIFSSLLVTAGSNSLSFPVPASARFGQTYARFRISTQNGLPWHGFGSLGEVEDYQALIEGIGGEVVGFATSAADFEGQQEAHAAFMQPATGERAETMVWGQPVAAVDATQFLNAHQVQLENVEAATINAEGDPQSIEQIDGYDGRYQANGTTMLVKLNNHESGLGIRFDEPVRGVGGFLATGKEGETNTLSIVAYDANGQVVGRTVAAVSPMDNSDNREGFWGLRAHDSLITHVTITNDNPTSYGSALLLGPITFLRSAAIACDLNQDGVADPADLELFRHAVAAGSEATQFDINLDGQVDRRDFYQYLIGCLNTNVGDSNGDGRFNTSDLVTTFQAGRYESGEPATWIEGDWNADGLFNSSDLIAAFQAGWYSAN